MLKHFIICLTLSTACLCAGDSIELVEFAVIGPGRSNAAILSALENGSVSGEVRWSADVAEDDTFTLGGTKIVHAVKEVDTDGTITQKSKHEIGTRCAGTITITDAADLIRIDAGYLFREVIGHRLFELDATHKEAIAQPVFRSMTQKIDVVLARGEWMVFTSVPKAGQAPSASGAKATVDAAAEAATTRVMAIRVVAAKE